MTIAAVSVRHPLLVSVLGVRSKFQVKLLKYIAAAFVAVPIAVFAFVAWCVVVLWWTTADVVKLVKRR